MKILMRDSKPDDGFLACIESDVFNRHQGSLNLARLPVGPDAARIICDKVKQVLQSRDEARIDGQFKISFIHVHLNLPAVGGGRPDLTNRRTHLTDTLAYLRSNPHCIEEVPRYDHNRMCAAQGLLLASGGFRNTAGTVQKKKLLDAAIRLRQWCGVTDPMHPTDAELWAKMFKHPLFRDRQIVVWSELGQKYIEKKGGGNAINLLQFDGHIFVVKNLRFLLGSRCKKCRRIVGSEAHDWCKSQRDRCPFCPQKVQCPVEWGSNDTELQCQDCERIFRRKACYYAHLQQQPFANNSNRLKAPVCQRFRMCSVCKKTDRIGNFDNGRHQESECNR